MCKYSYKKFSIDTGKEMIFCKLLGRDATLSQVCISQRFCHDKNKYVESKHPGKICKNFR